MLTAVYRYKISTSHPKWPKREGLILKRNNFYAEASPLPGFSRETLEEAIEDLSQALRFSRPAKTPSVQFALSCLDKPLRSVRLKMAALHSKPIETLKIKLGPLSVGKAIDLVQQHYQDYRLRLDFNRMWKLEDALEFASVFSVRDFDYLEEPVRSFDELVDFSRQTGFPIAVDESVGLNWSQIPSLKAVTVKPTLTGSIPKVPSPLKLILSSSYESGIGLLHIARLASEMQLKEPMGLDTYATLQNDPLISPIECKDGFFFWKKMDPPIDLENLCPIAL